jgi:hypothetical protein
MSVENTVSKYKLKTIGYFFEQNARNFNSPNVTLLHKTKEFNNIPFPGYFFINDVMDANKIWTCDMSRQPDLIAVYYSQNGFIKDPGHALSFLKICPADYRKHYEFIKREEFRDGGIISYYKHDL